MYWAAESPFHPGGLLCHPPKLRLQHSGQRGDVHIIHMAYTETSFSSKKPPLFDVSLSTNIAAVILSSFLLVAA